jgi:hypothetical protein
VRSRWAVAPAREVIGLISGELCPGREVPCAGGGIDSGTRRVSSRDLACIRHGIRIDAVPGTDTRHQVEPTRPQV